MSSIMVRESGGLAWIVLNRPEVYNAFDDQMMEEISQALKDLESNQAVRVVAFTGMGKVFASGADIASLKVMTPLDALFPKMQELYSRIYNFPKPTIAAVNGYALGGGLELAISCDIRVATPTARFGLPECKLGVIPGAGGTQRLVRILGEARVKEMVFLGEFINAGEALALGLVSRILESSDLEKGVAEYSEKIRQKAPMALRLAKMAINLSEDVSLNVGLLMENLAQSYLFGTKDKQEGVNAFLEKRAPNFKGI